MNENANVRHLEVGVKRKVACDGGLDFIRYSNVAPRFFNPLLGVWIF